MTIIISIVGRWAQQASDLGLILSHYNRRDELRRLVRWAARKKLSTPFKFYRERLRFEQMRLAHLQRRSPRLSAIAFLLNVFKNMLCGSQFEIEKGSAAVYKRRFA